MSGSEVYGDHDGYDGFNDEMYPQLLMTWFGATWRAPINDVCEHQVTPVGELCLRCSEPIERWASGVVNACFEADGVVRRQPQHLECFVRGTVGSVAHQLRRCSCYGGHEEDPPGLTMREAARAAVVVHVGRLEVWCVA